MGTSSSQYQVVAEKVNDLYDEGFMVVPPLGISLGTFGYFKNGKFCALGHLKTFLDGDGKIKKLLTEYLPSETGKSAQIKATMGFANSIDNKNQVKVNIQTGLPIEVGAELDVEYKMNSASSVLLSTMSLKKRSIVSPSMLIYMACKSDVFRNEAAEYVAEINKDCLKRIFVEKHIHIVTDVLEAKDGMYLMTTSRNSKTSFTTKASAKCTQVQGYGEMKFTASSALEESLSLDSDFVIAIKTKRFYHEKVLAFTDANLEERLAQLDRYFATGELPTLQELREEVQEQVVREEVETSGLGMSVPGYEPQFREVLREVVVKQVVRVPDKELMDAIERSSINVEDLEFVGVENMNQVICDKL